MEIVLCLNKNQYICINQTVKPDGLFFENQLTKWLNYERK